MRPAPVAVQNLLASGGEFVYADCFTFEFVLGATNGYYTNAQSSVTVIPIDGTLIARTFRADSVKVSGARMKMEVGVNVDEQDIEIDCPDSELLDGVPWPRAALWGFFDGCILRRDRFFATAWGQPWLGGAPMFLGRISTLDSVGRQSIKAKVKSYLVLADIQMPQELQQPGCNNTLYDSNCTVTQSSFTHAGACGGGTTASVINWGSAATQYSGGVVQMVTGPNAGLQRTIKQASSSQLILAYPFQFQPGVGDTFEASFGCDRTAATCDSVFSNNQLGGRNFRGMRFTPPPETAA